MALKREKKDKLAIRRPNDLWVDMDRMFDDFRTQFDDLFWPMSQKGRISTDLRTRNPPIDFADLGDKYEIHVEMPGISKDDINIEVTPYNIEISADHEENNEEKDKNWLRRERSYMSYYRSLELPEQIKSENVDAEFKDGVITVLLPKLEPKPKYKPSKVKIK